MSRKLDILKQSLIKKEFQLDEKFETHFETVKQANGQPLNDKRNGRATMDKWEKQNNAIRNLKSSIEKTKNAIEIEEGKLANIKYANSYISSEILDLVAKGELNQWRKYPNIFFVNGIKKARIIWDNKRNLVAHKYFNTIEDKEQRSKFVKLYNSLNAALN